MLDFHRNTGESLPSAMLKYPTNNMNMTKQHLALLCLGSIKQVVLIREFQRISKINPNNTINYSIEDFYKSVDNSLISIKEFHQLIDHKIKLYEYKISQKIIVKHKNLKRKK